MPDSEGMRDRLAMYNGNAFKLGLFGPNCSSGRAITKVAERWSGNWADNLALARMAEDAGLDFLLPIGRWKGYGGDTDYQGATWETVTWATALLAKTSRITVFATVHAPLLHPVIAAKEFVTADHVGEGRFGLNIVCGWNEGEFKMFGVAQRDLEARYEYGQEWIDVIRMMWERDDEFDFDGRYIKLEQVRSDPKPYGGTRPLIMNAGASPTGQEFAVRNCDALFCTPVGADTLEALTAGIQHAKTQAAAHGREIDVYSVGVVTCRATMRDAEDYHRHCIIDDADWRAIDNILAMKDIRPDTMPAEEFDRRRRHYAHGMGGIPIVGDPDHVAGEIARFAGAGLRGLGVSFVNYAEELPFFRDEVLPRLERMGLREPRG
jgi:alkanesulfonate monooxygenase SsuD/methylene tetrahydromethanopterin reductase-like flavin-dependent oxidoreductase (luciferase family)